MVFLKNARSFEVIQHLNRDLHESNAALRQTITDLTEARYRITALEKAKGHLKALFQQETERLGRASWLDFALILFTAALLAVLFNTSNPHGISALPETVFHSPAPQVDVTAARAMVQNGAAVMVDARPREFYARAHIEGAINVPASLFDLVYKMKLARMLGPGSIVIVYGRSISKRYDQEVAHRLKRRDHEQVMILSGGLTAWEKSGYPVVR
jgi:rhodanese-related sulfurtransferase